MSTKRGGYRYSRTWLQQPIYRQFLSSSLLIYKFSQMLQNKQIQKIYVPRLNCLVTGYTNISDNNVYPNHMHLLHVTVSNINLRIIFKPHANLQIMVRTSVQFQKNQNKTEGGVCTQGTQCPFTFIV